MCDGLNAITAADTDRDGWMMEVEREVGNKFDLKDFFFSSQANETFEFVGNLTHYTKVWLNISAQLRTFLEEGRLHRHLVWLQQVNISYHFFLQVCVAILSPFSTSK